MAPSSSRTPTRVEHEDYRLPSFSSNVGGREILMHLLRLLGHYRSVGHTGVNAGIPSWDPWNIPGMPEEANRREKYYVTDCSVLKCDSKNPATQTGFWKPRDLGWGIPGERIGLDPAQVTGLKTTYDFRTGETIYQEGSKGTSWIMDVYSLIDNGQVQDDLLICHVFKGNSRDYVARPRCAAHHQLHESPKEKEIHGQSNNSLLERPGGLLATHISSNEHLSPSHQQASMENGSLAQQQGFQLPNHINNQNTEFLATHINFNKHLSLPDQYHHQASKENGSSAAHRQGFRSPNHGCNQNTGEPINHHAIGQNNDNFDVELLEAILDSNIEGARDHNCITASTYFRNLEGPSDIGFLQTDGAFLPNDLAKENTGVEISMEMIENDMPKSSRVSASAENGPLGKRARTKSAVWEKFTKVTKAKVVLAVCNHCYKVMRGDSSNGTSHLKRHKCHCNH